MASKKPFLSNSETMKTFYTLLVLFFALGFFSLVTAQDKKLTTVNVGYAAISGSFAPLWVGFDQGLFTKYGLDVKMAYIQGNRVMMSALTAGEIQLYQGGAEGLIRLVSGGGDGIFVATQYNFVGHYVLMTDPSITRIEDLRGKRIALDPTYLRLHAQSIGTGWIEKRRRCFRAIRHRRPAGTGYGRAEETGFGDDSHRAKYLRGREAGTEKIFDHSRSRHPPAHYRYGDDEKIST
jgi:hypothetical protein